MERLDTAGTRLAYRPSEVACLLGVSKSFVYRLLARKTIRAVRVGRARLIPVEELDRLLREGLGESR